MLSVDPQVAFAMYGTIRRPCAAREPFVERVRAHAEGKIAFGFAERASIIEALFGELKIPGFADKARAIVTHTLDDHRMSIGAQN
jgi:hypothetical protein